MQFEYCQICTWSVPVGTLCCEVCTTLLANPAQTCLAEARVIVGQLWRSLGARAVQARYQDARKARREQEHHTWWETFVQRNGVSTPAKKRLARVTETDV